MDAVYRVGTRAVLVVRVGRCHRASDQLQCISECRFAGTRVGRVRSGPPPCNRVTRCGSPVPSPRVRPAAHSSGTSSVKIFGAAVAFRFARGYSAADGSRCVAPVSARPLPCRRATKREPTSLRVTTRAGQWRCWSLACMRLVARSSHAAVRAAAQSICGPKSPDRGNDRFPHVEQSSRRDRPEPADLPGHQHNLTLLTTASQGPGPDGGAIRGVLLRPERESAGLLRDPGLNWPAADEPEARACGRVASAVGPGRAEGQHP